MNPRCRQLLPSLCRVTGAIATAMLLPACLFESQPGSQPPDDLNPQNLPGFEVKFLAGSALGDFCEQAANQFNQQQPQLDDGSPFYLRCETKGSGDVVQEVVSLTEQLQAGTLAAEAPEFPTLISVDGEIYHSQMAYQVAQIVPGEDYIPAIATRHCSRTVRWC